MENNTEKLYRVSKYIDDIKKIEPTKKKKSFAVEVINLSMYDWFETFEKAKLHCINRAKSKIGTYKNEIKKLERKLKKLSELKEKQSNQ